MAAMAELAEATGGTLVDVEIAELDLVHDCASAAYCCTKPTRSKPEIHRVDPESGSTLRSYRDLQSNSNTMVLLEMGKQGGRRGAVQSRARAACAD
jgi:hypothetical protein